MAINDHSNIKQALSLKHIFNLISMLYKIYYRWHALCFSIFSDPIGGPTRHISFNIAQRESWIIYRRLFIDKLYR